MVDLSGGGPEGPIEHQFSNWVFVLPALITVALISFFFYKLINSLMDKEKKKEQKKLLKQQKKEQSAPGIKKKAK